MPRKRRIPGYLHHSSGQARVILDGQVHYLGKYGSPESKARYDELLGQWLSGRLSPTPAAPPASSALTVAELCALFLDHAERTYRKRGQPTLQVQRIAFSFAPLCRLFGTTAAVVFGPRALKAVRQTMIDAGLARTTVNTRIALIKQAWTWAVEEELLPGSSAFALRAVKGLPKGSAVAPERPAVKPVSWDVALRTLPELSVPLADAVRVQYLAGMRPCEVLAIRPEDIDRAGCVPDGPTLPGLWVYVVPPEYNKMAHKGIARHVLLGPQAQAILAPYLLRRTAGEYLFSPAEAVALVRAERSTRRKTPRYPSHQKANRQKRKTRPRRQPGSKYTTHAYGVAVKRAAARAGLPHWSVNQLRHARATDVRAQAGLDHAGTLLGHAQLSTSQVYAERDLEAVAELMRRIG